jgi:two-component system sensor histidine kinase PhoQ
VQVSARIRDGWLQLDVEDDGDGFATADVERLLHRGERADQRHPGEGIGLAVASEIVTQYGGSLDVGSSELGGAAIRVQLPLGNPNPCPMPSDQPSSSADRRRR